MTAPAARVRVLPWVAFTPYSIVALIHLWSKIMSDGELDAVTKPMLMPVLLIGFLFALPTLRHEVAVWGGLGILFSWAGDVFLQDPGSTGFLVGLGCFLVAHVAYLLLFVRGMGVRRVSRWSTLYGIWWVGLLVLLAPHTGSLLVPVAVYGLVLGAMAAVATSVSWPVAVGGALFVVSDSLLGINRFHPDLDVPYVHVLVMLTYMLAQGLIVWGAVHFARVRVAEGARRHPHATEVTREAR